jgi:hypothetical protein
VQIGGILAGFIYPLLAEQRSTPERLAIRVRIDAERVPEHVACATHPMTLHRPGPHVAVLSYQAKTPDDGRDVVVDYSLPPSPEDAKASLAVYTSPDRNQDPYFLLALPAPATLLRGFEAWAAAGVAGERRFTVTTDMAAAMRAADVVMALRIQKERMAAGLLPSLHEYAARFGLTEERLAEAAPGCLVMHPGPMNEGVEIAADVAAGPRSLVTGQVASGVPIRMAVLSLVASAAGITGPVGAA